MGKTTTTREFDGDGNVVKETVVTETDDFRDYRPYPQPSTRPIPRPFETGPWWGGGVIRVT